MWNFDKINKLFLKILHLAFLQVLKYSHLKFETYLRSSLKSKGGLIPAILAYHSLCSRSLCLTRARTEAIIRCEDLLSEFTEREKKESANSLRVSSQGLRIGPQLYLLCESAFEGSENCAKQCDSYLWLSNFSRKPTM